MELIIIGTGMYVSGRKTKEFGTVLPAVCKYYKDNKNLTKVSVVGTNLQRRVEAENKYFELSNKTGVKLPIKFFPSEKNSSNSYKHIIKKAKIGSSVIIAVPDHLHYQIIKDCLLFNLNILVVKPLTPTLSEGKRLVDIVKQRKLYGVVEFHKRWDKQNRILRDSFRSGDLGDPLYTWTEYSQRKSIPTKVFSSWVEKNNILQYLGVHYIDIIRFVTNASPKRVMAIGQNGWLYSNNVKVHDSIQCIIEWETKDKTKFTQTLLVNWVDPETSSSMSDQKIKFVGTKGRFEGDQKNRGIIVNSDTSQIEHINPDFCRSFMEDNLMSWEGYGIESITTFLDDVQKINSKLKKPSDFSNSRPTFSESLVSTAIIEAANKSIKNLSKWETINFY